jgi:iron complex outermembrane receptor protein
MAPKVTGYIQIQPVKNWDFELSVLHNFERDRFNPNPTTNKYSFNEGPVPSYTVFNIGSSYVINKHFKTALGIENLFNKDYSPNIAWWTVRNQDFVNSPGRRVTLQIQYSF